MSSENSLNAGAHPGGLSAPAAGMRVVRVADFEPAASVPADQQAAYVRRFVTLFVSDAHEQRGGMARIACARNAQGERLAVKLLTLPERDEDEPADAYERRVAGLRAAFQHEYECHSRLSGLKGFPRLYGRGTVEGTPALIMEWIEGVTLARAARALAIDDAGRLSPLTAARIARDVFDLVARMDVIDGGLVHRDISPRNVMVRTSRLSLAEQVDEGAFDLYLIDFGSSAQLTGRPTSFTASNAVVRGATADFAPPEMLSDDLPELDRLRKSSSIDVYAAASVAYRLAAGRAPYELHGVVLADGEVASPYRVKTAAPPAPPAMAHEGRDDIDALLMREPEVAVAVRHATDKLANPCPPADLRRALVQVDGLFAQVILDCLAREQDDRPVAAAVRDALASFSLRYADNVERALSGQPLIPCVPGGLAGGGADGLSSTLSVLCVAAYCIAGAAAAGVAISAGVLASGVYASFSAFGLAWSGKLSGPAVLAALLAVPAIGFAARGRGRKSRAGFVRGSFSLLIALGILGAAVSLTQFTPIGAASVLRRALVACAAAGWFPLVCDFALNVVVPKVALRRALPAPAAGTPAALGGAAAGELGDAAGGPEPAGKLDPAPAAGDSKAVGEPDPAPTDESQQTYEADEGDA